MKDIGKGEHEVSGAIMPGGEGFSLVRTDVSDWMYAERLRKEQVRPLYDVLAGTLHEEWRKKGNYRSEEMWRRETTDHDWIARNGGRTHVDIAHYSYAQLPADLQYEHLVLASTALELVRSMMNEGKDFSQEKVIEVASSLLYNSLWLERNSPLVLETQKIPYAEIGEENKERDRFAIREAYKLLVELPPA